ncbi:hypothetical protein CIG19_03240 [Enterobacterales bacterium CwR94]|nr:hypothetical protein CIG19_03240 [Enterobacterales bacterium CwR94]
MSTDRFNCEVALIKASCIATLKGLSGLSESVMNNITPVSWMSLLVYSTVLWASAAWMLMQ